jgi:hypothetical protein
MTKEPASGGPSAGSERESAFRMTRAAPALLAVCLSCSLGLDADRLQCDADVDCARRGFGDALCEQGLCSPSSELDDGLMSPARALDPPAAGEPVRLPEGPRYSAAPASDEPKLNGLLPAAAVRYELRIELPRRSDLDPADLELRLCRLQDEVCGDGGSAVTAPDATGLLALELDATFRGYLEIEGAELVPTLAALPLPYTPGVEPVSYRLLDRSDFELLLWRGELPRDEERGFAIALVHDAAGARTSGGELSLGETSDQNEDAVAYYFRDGVPTPAALSTDEQGAGGWSQLASGVFSAQARHETSGAPLGVAEFRARAGQVSIVPLQPPERP